jgi:hypothetical protein
MLDSDPQDLSEEERLVAELDLLGVRYLSRQTTYRPARVRSPQVLLVDLVRQPSARVRAAVIAVLLSHPEYAEAVSGALEHLGPSERFILRSFYVAAVLLQQQYAHELQPHMTLGWQWLPDLDRAAMGWDLPTEGTPREKLAALGREHRRRTREMVNWAGTYEQVASQLLRQWELESRWKQ